MNKSRNTPVYTGGKTMSEYSSFDIIGPVMVGPSSSHTAGAVRLGRFARAIAKETPKQVTIYLHGSFAKTYCGHGTDRALLGGIMGFSTYDTRIKDSFEIASSIGLEYSFETNEEDTEIYPNTVDITMTNDLGQTMSIRGESLGGGKVRIVRINKVKVDFTGEYSAAIVIHQDKPGVVAHITKCLSDDGVNIAFMRLFRESKGNIAYTIVESDDALPANLPQMLKENPNVHDVMIVQK